MVIITRHTTDNLANPTKYLDGDSARFVVESYPDPAQGTLFGAHHNHTVTCVLGDGNNVHIHMTPGEVLDIRVK